MSSPVQYGTRTVLLNDNVQWRSASPVGISTYGFRCDCLECGEHLEILHGSSVTAEDAPRSFAFSHRDCRDGRPFAVAPERVGGRYVWRAVNRQEAGVLAGWVRSGYVRWRDAWPTVEFGPERAA